MDKNLLSGIILKGVGGNYVVKTDSGLFVSRARGKFRYAKAKPLAGDKVLIEPLPEREGYIHKIEERKNDLVRPAVCNVDLIVLVVSAAPPKTDYFMIDKLLAIAAHKNIETLLCINKCDLDMGEELFSIYDNAGVQTVRVSAAEKIGIAQLKQRLKGKVCVFTGNSGVGKSSLLNVLMPELLLKTGDISVRIERGKHTTRHVELFSLDDDTYIADTPGFSLLDTECMDLARKEDLEDAFIEFAPYKETCRFVGCSHTKEKGCAIIDAVKEGKIAKSRHMSYVKLYESARKIQSWQIKEN